MNGQKSPTNESRNWIFYDLIMIIKKLYASCIDKLMNIKPAIIDRRLSSAGGNEAKGIDVYQIILSLLSTSCL